MKRIIPFIIILITGFFLSCGDEDQDPVGPGGVPLPNEDFSFFYLTIDDEEQHIFSVNFFNFQSVSKISFIIGFDSEVFTVNNGGIEFNQEYSLADEIGPNIESGTVGFWYDFMGSISGEGKLLTLDLEPVPGGNLQGTDIEFFFNEVILLYFQRNVICCINRYILPHVSSLLVLCGSYFEYA